MRAVDREAAWQKRVQRIGEFVDEVQTLEDQGVPAGAAMTGISIRFPTKERPEAFLVLKASAPTGAFVAFIGALDIGQAILIWRAKVKTRSLKWREDVPYTKR